MPEPAETALDAGASAPAELSVPIESRFLFVDVAAQRANQLRRGACARLNTTEVRRDPPHKLERVAMEEVRQRLIQYTVPGSRVPRVEK